MKFSLFYKKFLETTEYCQPFLDLTDTASSIETLRKREFISNIAKYGIKSLYFNTKELKLDATFASLITELEKAGICEILVFSEEEEKSLTHESFNQFLLKHKIKINLRVAPITQKQKSSIISQSHTQYKGLVTFDSITKNALAEQEIDLYSLKYGSEEVKLLNSTSQNKNSSDVIITDNYNNYRQEIYKETFQEAPLPQYITHNSQVVRKRVKDPKLLKPQLEINQVMQVDLSTEIDLQTKVEVDIEMKRAVQEELDIDFEQAKHKYDMDAAIKFYQEYDALFWSNSLLYGRYNSYRDSGSDNEIKYLIETIFKASPEITHITRDALFLILHNEYSFKCGINLSNLPVGLAFTDGCIFTSKARSNSMPIDDFTVKFNDLRAGMESSLHYSWLYYAVAKNNGTLLKRFEKTDPNKIDIFYSYDYTASKKSIKELKLATRPDATSAEVPSLVSMKFKALSEQDITCLKKIHKELLDRKLFPLFLNVIGYAIYNSSEDELFLSRGEGLDYLLKPSAMIVVHKIIYELFPLHNTKKIDFVAAFYEKIMARPNRLLHGRQLEDFFEALSKVYDEMEDLIEREGLELPEDIKTVKNFFLEISEHIFTSLGNSRVPAQRFIDVLKYTMKNGGNLLEQLEYIKKDRYIAISPKSLYVAEDLNFTVVDKHFSLRTDKQNKMPKNFRDYLEILHQEENLSVLGSLAGYFTAANKSEKYDYKMYYESAYNYLATLPAHKRPSLISHHKFIFMMHMIGFSEVPCENSKQRAWYDKILEEAKALKKEGGEDYQKNVEEIISKKEEEEKSRRFEKAKTKHIEYGVGVGEKAPLIIDFSEAQANENMRLFLLNVMSSAGKHYDPQLPERDFAEYISLFSILFSEFKFNDEILYSKIKKDPDSINLDDLEQDHKKLIAIFTGIFAKNTNLNFNQVVALGLIKHFHGNTAYLEALEQVKELSKIAPYHVAYFLRVLTTSADTGRNESDDLQSLALITKNTKKHLSFLTREIEYNGKEMPVYKIITNDGQNPENIILYAECFKNEQGFAPKKIRTFIDKINGLDIALKNDLISKFQRNKLPFEGGRIVKSNFPSVTLDILDLPEVLKNIVHNTSEYIDKDAIKFNTIGINAALNLPVDLSALERKYKKQFPQVLKDKSYLYVRSYIKDKENFILELFNAQAVDPKTIEAFSLDLLKAIFGSINSNRHIGELIAELLYDPKIPLHKQIDFLDSTRGIINKLLKRVEEKGQEFFIKLLSEEPRIRSEALRELALYLQSLDKKLLADKKLTLQTILYSTGNKIINESFDLFKIATDFYLNSNLDIELGELFKFVNMFSSSNKGAEALTKIFHYCTKHFNLILIKILFNYKGDSNALDSIVNILARRSPEDLESIQQCLGFAIKDFLEIEDAQKTKSLITIALTWKESITPTQYRLLINSFQEKDLKYTKQLTKILLEHKGDAEYLKTVMQNLYSSENFQDASQNHFTIDSTDLIKKITSITHIREGDKEKLTLSEQVDLYRSYITVLERAEKYKDLSDSEIRDYALQLKHDRALLKHGKIAEIRDIDFEFLALSTIAMHNETGNFPRDTQLLSILNTLIHNYNMIQEIATGQGKSLIAAMHAAFLCYTGQTVDVLSSSRYLAQEGINKFEDFYQTLGLRCGDEIIIPTSHASKYVKGGINHTTASDIGLFRAIRDFYSETMDFSLNTNVSAVIDEIDKFLTSEVNSKLSVPIVALTQEETSVFFKHILLFTEGPPFIYPDKEGKEKYPEISSEDDVANLKKYFEYLFVKYDKNFQFPLNVLQLKVLQQNAMSGNETARELYELHSALCKCKKRDEDSLFNAWLNSAIKVKVLQKGTHFVMPDKEELKDPNQSLQAIPVIKSQPTSGPKYGDGVQNFLHLLLERDPKNKKYVGRFDMSAPTDTLIDISPKNTVNHYTETGGTVVGMTGTVGNNKTVMEFRKVNKLASFSIPRFIESKREDLSSIECDNINNQRNALLQKLNEENSERPILIFCDDTNKAEELFNLLNKQDFEDRLQLFAKSEYDTASLEKVVSESGKNNRITITTPMLGRGVDYHTRHSLGFLAFNLCTNITPNTFGQICGRVARNGHPGTTQSIFDKSKYVGNTKDFKEHMDALAEQERFMRARYRPLTDILKFFTKVNRGSTHSAIDTNKKISEVWDKILKKNKEEITNAVDLEATYLNFRSKLVEQVIQLFPNSKAGLVKYLEKIDSDLPAKLISPNRVNSLTSLLQAGKLNSYKSGKYSAQLFAKFDYTGEAQDKIDPFIPIYAEPSKRYEVDYQSPIIPPSTQPLSLALKSASDVENLYNAIPLDYLSTTDLTSNQGLYTAFIQAQTAVMATHAFSIKAKKDFTLNLGKKEQQGNEDKLLKFSGEGSRSNLMLSEFRKSFSYYQKRVKSIEVNKLSKIIDRFIGTNDAKFLQFDPSKLIEGEYQALNITTKFQTHKAKEVESKTSNTNVSILTNGKFLFLINRGAGGGSPGIKLFKIKENFAKVQNIFKSLKEQYISNGGLEEELSKISKLIGYAEGVEEAPPHVTIPMKSQVIDNKGWVQVKSMLKAIAIAAQMGDMEELPDHTSQEWQEIIKNADDIYKDFTTYDRITRAEAIAYMVDQAFAPKFLDEKEREKIDNRRENIENPVLQQLIDEMALVFKSKGEKFERTIYEKQALQLEIFFNIKKSDKKYNDDFWMEKIEQFSKNAQKKGISIDNLKGSVLKLFKGFAEIEDISRKNIDSFFKSLSKKDLEYLNNIRIGNREQAFKKFHEIINREKVFKRQINKIYTKAWLLDEELKGILECYTANEMAQAFWEIKEKHTTFDISNAFQFFYSIKYSTDLIKNFASKSTATLYKKIMNFFEQEEYCKNNTFVTPEKDRALREEYKKNASSVSPPLFEHLFCYFKAYNIENKKKLLKEIAKHQALLLEPEISVIVLNAQAELIKDGKLKLENSLFQAQAQVSKYTKYIKSEITKNVPDSSEEIDNTISKLFQKLQEKPYIFTHTSARKFCSCVNEILQIEQKIAKGDYISRNKFQNAHKNLLKVVDWKEFGYQEGKIPLQEKLQELEESYKTKQNSLAFTIWRVWQYIYEHKEIITIALVIGAVAITAYQFGLVYTASTFVIDSVQPAIEVTKQASNCILMLIKNVSLCRDS